MIRSEKINKLIISRLLEGEACDSVNNPECIILDSQKEKGREWIVDYFEKLSIDKISPELIIGINNIRSCLKLTSINNEKLIFWSQLNKMIEKCS